MAQSGLIEGLRPLGAIFWPQSAGPGRKFVCGHRPDDATIVMRRRWSGIATRPDPA
jgi:hypothetical protein